MGYPANVDPARFARQADTNIFQFVSSRCGPFNLSSKLYGFFLNYSVNQLQCWRSTDNGLTWTICDGANSKPVAPGSYIADENGFLAGTTQAKQYWAVIDTNNIIHVLYVHTDWNWAIATFSLATETWGTSATGGPQQRRLWNTGASGQPVYLENPQFESLQGILLWRASDGARIVIYTSQPDIYKLTLLGYTGDVALDRVAGAVCTAAGSWTNGLPVGGEAVASLVDGADPDNQAAYRLATAIIGDSGSGSGWVHPIMERLPYSPIHGTTNETFVDSPFNGGASVGRTYLTIDTVESNPGSDPNISLFRSIGEGLGGSVGLLPAIEDIIDSNTDPSTKTKTITAYRADLTVITPTYAREVVSGPSIDDGTGPKGGNAYTSARDKDGNSLFIWANATSFSAPALIYGVKNTGTWQAIQTLFDASGTTNPATHGITRGISANALPSAISTSGYGLFTDGWDPSLSEGEWARYWQGTGGIAGVGNLNTPGGIVQPGIPSSGSGNMYL